MGKGQYEFFIKHPAKGWENGLPVGNGRQGAVLYGTAQTERLLLNEESLWCGGRKERGNIPSKEAREHAIELLKNGQAQEAEEYYFRKFNSLPRYLESFQPAAEVAIQFWQDRSEAENYKRGICLDEGTAWVSFTQSGQEYRRELFASHKYQVIVLRLATSGSKKMRFQLAIERRPFEQEGINREDAVYLKGQCGDGVHYCVGAMIGDTDGRTESDGSYLFVENASYAELLFCTKTDYEGGDPFKECAGSLAAAKKAGYQAVYREHQREYGALYQSMVLKINEEETEKYSSLEVPELLKRSREDGISAYLSALLFAYARYLMICSSFDCALPANLQGIWNGSYTPPWESGYTININLEMNYWPADGAGLGVCYNAFENLLKKMLPRGQKTARDIYGCDGFVAHHNTDLWGDTDIVGAWLPAYCWPMSGAWMAAQFYNHSLYEEDEEKIREFVLPLLGECVKFFYDYLYRDDNGSWVSGPGVSPENTYRLPDGQEACLALGCTMDHQIIREVAEDYLEGVERFLNCKSTEIYGKAQEILKHLPPTRLGKDGRILEWQEEYEEVEPGHRHISHLYGLYPGKEISEETKELWEGARKTLSYRLTNGGGHTGWSRAWIQCFYARLGDGKEFSNQLKLFFEKSVAENLWDMHPPFQIDGNFGMAAAVLEALAVRRKDKIKILQAIPEEWKQGKVQGQRLPGQISLSYEWKNGTLSSLEIYSGKEQEVLLVSKGVERKIQLKQGENKVL